VAGPIIIATQAIITVDNDNNKDYSFALVSLTSLFFVWGFITCLNDILIPYLKNIFSLTYSQAMLVQFCFFGAYFLVSIPSGVIIKKVGYQKGIVIGLLIASLGCALFYPAASMQSYPVFLGALFVLASGITLLQVSANPYVSILGEEKTASSRLTLTQAFNSLGTTIAPYFGGLLILGAATESMTTTQGAEAVQIPYLLLATSLLTLAAIFAYIKLPNLGQASQETQSKVNPSGTAWQYRHLVLGAIGIFVYVGAEVGIGSLLISFMGMEKIAGLEEADAAIYLTYFWGGSMVGRFIGAAVMQKISGGKVLFFNATIACILLIIGMLSTGKMAMWALLLIGLCNSIMFPTIFSLAIIGLKEHTSQGSSILCLAIVGGAIIPLLQGIIADSFGVQISFILPLVCFVFIAYYGIKGCLPQVKLKI
jgi:FHS family L-fucose permease-like MFS transporter